MQGVVGIDMAADSFQAELVLPDHSRKRQKFENNEPGFAKLVAWAKSAGMALRFCMEATGRYGEALAKFLYVNGHEIRVANPKRIRRFAEGLGLLGKSDKVDAHAIAEYACHHFDKVAVWKPRSPARDALRDLQCHIRGLEKAKSAFSNRQRCGITDEYVKDSMQAIVDEIDKQLDAAKARANEILNGDEQLKEDRRALEEQIGVGEVCSRMLLTCIDFRSFGSARAAARFTGITPKREQSGTSINRPGKISKEGPRCLRAVLYMGAKSAMVNDPVLRAFSERLKARGKPYQLIVIAVMRKIVMRSWAIVTKGRRFDPAYNNEAVLLPAR